MKSKSIRLLSLFAAFAAAAPVVYPQTAPAQPAEKREPGALRFRTHQSPMAETRGPVTFLGVEAASAGPALTEQLGLTPGMGLVVQTVLPDSPAAAGLKRHDVLTKLDDQWLVNAEQLAVLVRSREEGEEVTLTYIRGGKTATATVKLGRHTAPVNLGGGQPGFRWDHAIEGVHPVPGARFEMRRLPGSLPRVEVDRTLSLLGEGFAAGDVTIRPGSPPIARILGLGEGNLMFSDDQGSLEIRTVEGRRELVARDAADAVIFSGPITTEEERKALPEAVRVRLQKMEGINTLRFRTEEDFPGGEVRVLVPGAQARPIFQPAVKGLEAGRTVL